MSISKTLYGVLRIIPQTKERQWGAQVTSILADLIDGVDGTTVLLTNGNGILKPSIVSQTFAASATLTVSNGLHRVASTGGAITLNATTAIADGEADGVIVIIVGTSNTDTVQIPNGANTRLNGAMILGQGDIIALTWNNTDSVWEELYRNN